MARRDFTLGIACLLGAALVAGCGPKHVAQLEPVPPIAFHYAPKQAQTSTSTPVFAAALPSKVDVELNWNAFLEQRRQRLAALGLPVPPSGNAPEKNTVSSKLKSAFEQDLLAILRAKKVEVTDAYEDYDEIPFAAKKRLHYLIKPSVTFSIQDVITSSERKSGGIIDHGYYQGTMRVRLTFLEPMTKEVVFTKKVQMRLKSKPYVHAYLEENAGGGGIFSLVTKVQQASFKVQDDRLARRNALINALYAQTMAKLDALLDPEELRSNLAAVQELKERKRY